MSRKIDVTDLSRLSETEAVYAHARNMITDDQMREMGYDPARGVMTDPPLAFQPNTGDANTRGLSQVDLDKRQVDEEDLEPSEENLTEPQVQGRKVAQPLEFDGESDDEDVEVDPDDSYDNWTNDRLRAELAARELSVDGKKADLVARLEEDDAKEDDAKED